MKMFFKAAWTGMLLTYIYCNDVAMKRFPKATVLSWIMRHVLVFILISIDIVLIPIMSIIMIIKVIRLGMHQVEEDNRQYVNRIVGSDILSDQGREDSIEVLNHLLDEK